MTSIAFDRSHVRPSAAAIVPFTVLGVVGVLSALSLLRDASTPLLASLVGVAILSGAAEVASIRRHRRTWLTPVGSYTYFVMFVLLRQATGGSESVMSPLVAIPVLWLALFGTRAQVVVAAVLTFVSFMIAPILDSTPFVGDDIRRALLWTTFALTVAPLVQRLVSELEERTEAERAGGARLRGVLQGATMSSLITTDLNGIITSVNNGTEDLLGRAADELVGREAIEVLHVQAEVDEVAAQLGVDDPSWVLAHLAQQQAPSRTWRYRHKNGEHLHVRLAVTELRDDDGMIVGHLAIGIDATEAVRSSAALAESEQRWRLMMDHLPDMTALVLDEDLHVSMVAGAGASRHGVAGSTGSSLGSISSPGNVTLLTDGVRAALTGDVRGATIDLRATVSGAEHTVTFCPLPQEEGERPTVLALARDVSVERARERAVAAARDRAEKLVDNAPHGIAVMHRDGTLTEVNPALADLLGRTPTQLVGSSLASLVTPGDEAVARRLSTPASRAASLATGGQRSTHWLARRDDGSVAHLAVGGTVLDADATEDEILLTFTDVTERHAHEQELTWLADHDALTGLANRRRFGVELLRHLARCQRDGAHGALLVVDLDNFKAVNDALGHAAGDEVLTSVARTLRLAVRDTDVVARLGGDEFAVLLTHATRAEAEHVADRVVRQVGTTTQHDEKTGAPVTASVGIAMVERDTLEPDSFLAAADRRMYDAKRRGRNQWVATTDNRPAAARRSSDAPDARRSRLIGPDAHRDMELHLQPIWDVTTRRVVGAEALLRLLDGPRVILPQPFVTRAERQGLIGELDCWTVGEAVRVLSLMRSVAPDIHIGVNVSGATLGDPAYEAALRTALAVHDVDASTLLLEVTETAAITDLEASVAFAERMVERGTRLALDDFGTGYASLACLRRLPFSFIKIDGAFVAGSVHGGLDRSILASTVDLARRLGVKTVAEHVADEDTLRTVRAEDVDLAQGYLVGPAVPWGEFVDRHVPDARHAPVR